MAIDNSPSTPLVDAVRRTHAATAAELPDIPQSQDRVPAAARVDNRSRGVSRRTKRNARRTIRLFVLAALAAVGIWYLSAGGGLASILRQANSTAVELAATNPTAADALNLLGFNAIRSAAGQGPYCDVHHPVFLYGFAALKVQIGAKMGDPLECEHAIYPTGDTHQLTSSGLAYYRRGVNIPSFVSGADHWALTVKGLQHWIGDVVDPPGTAAPEDAQD